MIEQKFKDLILADAPLVALLGTRVYTFTALGLTGLTHTNPLSTSAFLIENNIPKIRPTIVIRNRRDTPNYERSDNFTQDLSYDGVVELWCYSYKDYAVLDTIREHLARLFTMRVYPILGYVIPQQVLTGLTAPEFKDSALIRLDFNYSRVKRRIS